MNNDTELFELWRTVLFYDGLYEVSNLGRVRSLGGRRGTSGKILKQGYIKGYACVSLSKNGVRTTYLVHRLVAESFLYNGDNLPEVNHKDGDKLNNSFTNLEWIDRDGNMKHAKDTSLVNNKGEKHGMSILIEEEVRYIRSSDETNTVLALQYAVSPQTISDIRLGKSWKHLDNAGVRL